MVDWTWWVGGWVGEYENENGFCRGGAENENDEVVADPENEKSERDIATRAGGGPSRSRQPKMRSAPSQRTRDRQTVDDS